MTRDRVSFLVTALFVATPVPVLAGYTFLSVPDRMDYAFDSSGTLYVSAGSSIVRYNAATSSYLSPYSVGGNLIGIDLSLDGSTLAIADSTTQGGNNRIWMVDRATGTPTSASFTRASGESGTFMVAWGADNKVLTTSYFSGSGWVPLRRYDPSTSSAAVVTSVRQNTMLTPNASRQTVALAENNISSGPVRAYDCGTGSIGASVSTGWFTFEVAVDRAGTDFLVPTYGGGFVYSRNGSSFTHERTLGAYASYGPIAGAFSPVADVLFTAEYDWDGSRSGVKVYDTNTWSLLATLDNYDFDWNGNHSMGEGRMEISPDGRWLVVSVQNGARLYDVSAYIPEPAAGLLLAIGAVLVRGRRPRR